MAALTTLLPGEGTSLALGRIPPSWSSLSSKRSVATCGGGVSLSIRLSSSSSSSSSSFSSCRRRCYLATTVRGRPSTFVVTARAARRKAKWERVGDDATSRGSEPRAPRPTSTGSSSAVRRGMMVATTLLGSGQLWSLSISGGGGGGGGGGDFEISGDGVNKYFVHVVEPGDTLSDIALDYHVELRTLRKANGLMHEGKGRESWQQVLYEGQRLKVPVTSENIHLTDLDAAARARKGGGGGDSGSTQHSRGFVASDANDVAAAEGSTTSRNPESSSSSSSSPSTSKSSSKTDPAADGFKYRGGGSRIANTGDDNNVAATASASASEWRIPYVHMTLGQNTQLTRAELEMMLPQKKVFAQESVGPEGNVRDADVLVLVETPDCVWCDKVKPTWKKLARKLAKSNPEIRVCAYTADSPTAKVFVGTHLAAKSYPTVIALPRHGGVYKYGGTDRSVDMLTSFANEAFQDPAAAREAEAAARAAEAAARGVAPKAAVTGTTTLTQGKDAVTTADEKGGGWRERRERKRDERRREKEEEKKKEKKQQEENEKQQRRRRRQNLKEEEEEGEGLARRGGENEEDGSRNQRRTGFWGRVRRKRAKQEDEDFSTKSSSSSSSKPAWERDGLGDWGGRPSSSSSSSSIGVAVGGMNFDGFLNVVKVAAPFAFTGLIIGLFVSAVLKLVLPRPVAPPPASPSPSPSHSQGGGGGGEEEGGAGGGGGAHETYGGSAAAAASAVGGQAQSGGEDIEGGGGGGDDDVGTSSSSSSSLKEAERAERRRRRGEEEEEEREARRRAKEENAIPAGASLERLRTWSRMVESEMTALARRLLFLLGAWFRLQARLIRGYVKHIISSTADERRKL